MLFRIFHVTKFWVLELGILPNDLICVVFLSHNLHTYPLCAVCAYMHIFRAYFIPPPHTHNALRIFFCEWDCNDFCFRWGEVTTFFCSKSYNFVFCYNMREYFFYEVFGPTQTLRGVLKFVHKIRKGLSKIVWLQFFFCVCVYFNFLWRTF